MMQYRIALVFACVAWCFLTSASASSCHYIKTVARKLGVDLRTIWDAEVHINGNSINLGQDDSLSSASAHSDGLDLGSPLAAHTVLLLSHPGIRAQQERNKFRDSASVVAPLYSLLTCYSADELCGETTTHELASSTEQPGCHILQCETYLPSGADGSQDNVQHLRGEVSTALSWGGSFSGSRTSPTSLTDEFLSESSHADVIFIDLDNFEVFLESGSTATVSAYVKHICDGTVLLLDASPAHRVAARNDQRSRGTKNSMNAVGDTSMALRDLNTAAVTHTHLLFRQLPGVVLGDFEHHHRHLSQITTPVLNTTQSGGVAPPAAATEPPAANTTQAGVTDPAAATAVTPPAGAAQPPAANATQAVSPADMNTTVTPAPEANNTPGVLPLDSGDPGWDWAPGSSWNDSQQSGSTFGMTEVEPRDLSDEEKDAGNDTTGNVVLALASIVTALLFVGAVYTGLLYRRRLKEHQLALYAEQQSGERSEFTIHTNDLHRQHVMITNSAAAYVSGTGDGSETALPGEEVATPDDHAGTPSLPSMTRWA